MSYYDHLLRNRLVSNLRRSRNPFVDRSVLCLLAGGADAACAILIILATTIAYHALVLGTPMPEFPIFFYCAYAALAGFGHGAFAVLAYNRFLDRRQPSHAGARDAAYGWTAALALTMLTAFLTGQVGDLSRVSLTSAYFIGIPLLIVVRAAVQTEIRSRIHNGALHFESLSVIGNRLDILNFLINGDLWRNGHRLANTLYLEDIRDDAGSIDRRPIIEFAASNLRQGTDHIVFVGSLVDFDEIENVVSQLKRFAVNVLYAPATGNRSLKFLDVVSIGPNNVLRFLRTPMSDAAMIAKRLLDIVCAGLGLVALGPVMALVALAIKLDSPGPVIFRQDRRGFNGETFMMWKFRSMRVMETGSTVRQARAGDPRITRTGSFLRRTSLDELPQLVNVLAGQMSIVGPRPHAVSHDDELARQVARYADRQRIKPGITGWAQVNGYRGETAHHEQAEGRITRDIYYIENWSLFLDIWIVVLTIFSPTTRRNAR